MMSDAPGEQEDAFIDLVGGISTVAEGAGLFDHLVSRYEEAVNEMPADELPERLAATVARYTAIASLVLDRLTELGPTTQAEQELIRALAEAKTRRINAKPMPDRMFSPRWLQ